MIDLEGNTPRWRERGEALLLDSVALSYHAGDHSCAASIRVLSGVDLAVRPGEVVGVVGSRGAGKTTLLLICAGILRPDVGRVRCWGSDPRTPKGASMVSYVPLHYSARMLRRPPATITVREILHGARAHGSRALSAGQESRASSVGSRRRIDRIVEALGLQDLVDTRLVDLLDAQLMGVALALAITTARRVICIDDAIHRLGNRYPDAPEKGPSHTHRTRLRGEHGAPSHAFGDSERSGREYLRRAIAILVRSGVSVLLAADRADAIQFIATRSVTLLHGRLIPSGAALAAPDARRIAKLQPLAPRAARQIVTLQPLAQPAAHQIAPLAPALTANQVLPSLRPFAARPSGLELPLANQGGAPRG